MREMARRHGVPAPVVLFWPDEDLPAAAGAAYYVIQGKPIFFLGERLRPDDEASETPAMTADETACVFAHELAHHLLRHVKLSAAANVLADVAAAGAACAAASRLPLAQSAGLELFELAAGILAAWVAVRACLQALVCFYSRRQELAADRKAVEITGDAAAFASAYSKLATPAGTGFRKPYWWNVLLSDTPTLQRRLAAMKEWTSE
jgi:Zn-dependent protease with chaperone function